MYSHLLNIELQYSQEQRMERKKKPLQQVKQEPVLLLWITPIDGLGKIA